MGSRITITDLAKLTGFSKTTISHVVNNTKGARIRTETRELIQKAAREHNYVPNFFARNIIRGKTRFLGFLTHDLDEACRSGELLGAEEVCHASGYHLILVNAARPDVSEPELVDQLVQQGMEGLYADWFEAPKAALERFDQFGIRLALGQMPEGDIAADCVFEETRKGLAAVGEKLSQLGHKSLLVASTGATAQKRMEKIARDTFLPLGLAVGGIEVRGRALAGDMAWLESDSAAPAPTALVCFDAPLALGILARLLTHGKRVPQDLSMLVVGPAAELGSERPSLARLSWPTRERASRSMERLIQRAEGKTAEDLPHLSLGLAPAFIEGQSLGPAAPRL